MFVAIDVHYDDDTTAHAAAVVFEQWSSKAPVAEYRQRATGFGPYQPGEFFRRELPCVLPLLGRVRAQHSIAVVVVDSYVDLPTGPGFGRHLHDALDGPAVVGVAKNRFREAVAAEVNRAGGRPLFVSAAGMATADAAAGVRSMDGPFRFPALLLRVDHLARGLPL